MIYSLLYSANYTNFEVLTSGIYSFKNQNKGLMNVKIDKNKDISIDDIEDFKVSLINILDNIFDKEQDFVENIK